MADDNSSSTMIVALIAILVIVALGFIVMQVLPMGDNDSTIDVNLNDDGGGVDLPDSSPN